MWERKEDIYIYINIETQNVEEETCANVFAPMRPIPSYVTPINDRSQYADHK